MIYIYIRSGLGKCYAHRHSLDKSWYFSVYWRKWAARLKGNVQIYEYKTEKLNRVKNQANGLIFLSLCEGNGRRAAQS